MPLDESARNTVASLEAKKEPHVAAIVKWNTAINAIYEANDEPAPYDVTESQGSAPDRPRYGRGDFHGVPLATGVKRVLEDLGPQKDVELCKILTDAGMDTNLAALRVSLQKNPAFTQLRNECWVRAAPASARGRRRVRLNDAPGDSTSATESDADDQPEASDE